MYKLPFPVAHDNDGLMNNIIQFDEVDYKNKLDGFMSEMGIFEDGCASKRVVDLIRKMGNERSKK